MAFKTTQLEKDRYLEGMVRCGRITKVSTKKCIAATVTYPDRGFQTGFLTVLQRNTIGTQDYYCPVQGEPVWVLMQGTNLSRGLILGSAYTEDNPPPYGVQTIRGTVFADGGYVIYDTAGGGNYQINAVGQMTINVGTSLTINAGSVVYVTAPMINLNGVEIDSAGNVQVPGNFKVLGTVTFERGGTIAQHLTNLDGAGAGA